MSQKSSDPQAISFVSQPLKRDIHLPMGQLAARRRGHRGTSFRKPANVAWIEKDGNNLLE
jgi:hypothetical protein